MSEARRLAESAASDALAGRRILVTGADEPLTRAIAARAVDRRAVVALTPMDDRTGEADVDQLFDRTAASLAALDTVIAAIASRPVPPLHNLSLDCWRDRVTQPLRQMFWLTRRAVEGFLADGVAGRLVLVVEPVGAEPVANDVVATALRSLASSFAREYGRRGMACNLVIASAPAEDEGIAAAVVEQALFLASPAASFINGESIVVRATASANRA